MAVTQTKMKSGEDLAEKNSNAETGYVFNISVNVPWFLLFRCYLGLQAWRKSHKQFQDQRLIIVY